MKENSLLSNKSMAEKVFLCMLLLLLITGVETLHTY